MIGWSLAAVGVLWGLFTYGVFRRFTDHAALRTVRKRLYAHLLEIRLYSEEPSVVWRAQAALVADNVRFLALIALPVLIMALSFALLYTPLDTVYGWGPLAVGRSAVVTLQLPQEPGAIDTQYILKAPTGIAVETAPVRDVAGRQIIWRIRPLMPVFGSLHVTLPGGSDVSMSIAAGDRKLSRYRRREPAPGAGWIEVDYPKANVAIAGLELPWLAWFLIVSTASAALFAIWPARRAF